MPNIWFGEWESWEYGVCIYSSKTQAPKTLQISSESSSELSSEEIEMLEQEKENDRASEYDSEGFKGFDPEAVERINENINDTINKHGGDREVVTEAAVIFERLFGNIFK